MPFITFIPKITHSFLKIVTGLIYFMHCGVVDSMGGSACRCGMSRWSKFGSCCKCGRCIRFSRCGMSRCSKFGSCCKCVRCIRFSRCGMCGIGLGVEY